MGPNCKITNSYHVGTIEQQPDMALNVYHNVADVTNTQSKYVIADDTGIAFCKEFDYVMTTEAGNSLTMTESDDKTQLQFTLLKTAPLNLNQVEVQVSIRLKNAPS